MSYTNADIRMDMDWDKYDAWGSVQAGLFDLCDAWFYATSRKLEGYEPSIGLQSYQNDALSWRAGWWASHIESGDLTSDQVHYWFKILNKLQGLVKAAGRDY